MNETTDVQLGRLDERVKNLDRKFDEHAKTLLLEIKELRDGLAGRMDKVENTKFPSIDFIQFRNNEFVPLAEKVSSLWDYRWKIVAIAFLGGIIGSVLLRLLNKQLGI